MAIRPRSPPRDAGRAPSGWRPARAPVVRAFLVAIVAAGLAAGCAELRPLTQAQVAERVVRHRDIIRAAPSEIDQPLTLGGAVARAINYNLDLRVAALEQVIARGNVDLADLDKLPRIVLSAGYTRRDRASGVNTDTRPGQFERLTSSGELSWSVIDFGVAYIRALQDGNTAFIADERRRKMANQIVNDVRTGYWQLVLGRQRSVEARAIAKDIEDALALSAKLGGAKLQDPLIGLNYRDGLIELQRQLTQHEVELAVAHAQLARLLNLHPRQQIPLVTAPVDESYRMLRGIDRDTLEDAALLTRTELREADYTMRNRRLDVIRSYVTMAPSLRLRAAAMHDNTNTLNVNDWGEHGLSLSIDLLGIYSALLRVAQAERGVAQADLRRLVISMAIMEQVSNSVDRISGLSRDYELAREATKVRRAIYETRRQRMPFDVGDELERVRAAVGVLSAQLREDRAFVSLQAAHGDLLAAIGVDQVPDDLAVADAVAAGAAVDRHFTTLADRVRAATQGVREPGAARPPAAVSATSPGR